MKRRSFIKLASAICTAATTGLSLAVESKPDISVSDFDPLNIYGDEIQFKDGVDVDMVKTELIEDVILRVPVKYHDRVKFLVVHPGTHSRSDPFGIYGCVSWEYTPAGLSYGA
jgi:hypothetical protein